MDNTAQAAADRIRAERIAAGTIGHVRCPGCLTHGTPHEVDGDECRALAYERAVSQADE